MSTPARTLRLARGRLATPSAVRPRASVRRQQARLQSTQPQPAAPTAKAGSSGLIGGLAGGAIVVALGYGWYSFSGAKTTVDTLHGAKAYYESATKSLREGKDKLEPSETVQWLKSTTYQYAGFIPGAKATLDKAFDSLDEVQRKHGDELTSIINEAYGELRKLVKDGSLDAATAATAWSILTKQVQKIEELAKDVGKDILSEHPELQKQYGDKLSKLKQMGEKQGGEAKKYADEAWEKVQDMVKQGKFDKDSIGKLVNDAMSKAQDYGDDFYNKAMEKAKPYLDKQPEIKKMLEENADKLKSSDITGLTQKLQDAVQSGNMQPLKEWMDKTVGEAQGMGEQAWKSAMMRASIYLDKNPELKKLVEDKGDALKKIDFDEFMSKLRESQKTGDIKPVQQYVEKQLQNLK